VNWFILFSVFIVVATAMLQR